MLATQTLQSASPRDALRRGPLLAIVVPTFNEHDNIAPALAAARPGLAGVHWEVVFVDDDSTDGTLAGWRALPRRPPRAPCAPHRPARAGLGGRRGHPDQLRARSSPSWMPTCSTTSACWRPCWRCCAATRPTSSSARAIRGRRRRRLEQGAAADQRGGHAAVAPRAQRSNLTDPMSGFFMLKRDAFDAACAGCPARLQDPARHPGLLARPLRMMELPYVFGAASTARASSTAW